MTTTDVEHAGARRGRSARQAERLARGLEIAARTSPASSHPVEVISTEGLETIEHNADTLLEEVGIEIVNYPEAVEIFRGAGADADGHAGPLPARPVPLAHPGDGAARLHPARPQPGAERRHRRSVHGPRADLRLAVHPQPRRRPALRDDRGLPQLREADLHEPDAPPRRRHAVRAGRPAGQQAPPRHGLQPHPVLGPGVHGLGHAPEPGPGLGRHGAHRVRRRDHGARARDHGPGQRQLADVVGLQHARLGQGLRREQPDHAHHPVHPRRRDGTR